MCSWVNIYEVSFDIHLNESRILVIHFAPPPVFQIMNTPCPEIISSLKNVDNTHYTPFLLLQLIRPIR